MGYYLRAFCTSDDVPPLRAVFDWAEGQGVSFQAPSADLDARGWEQAEVVYKRDRQPFRAEANTGEFLREEVEEFVEFLEDVDESPEKQKVLDHLEQSKGLSQRSYSAKSTTTATRPSECSSHTTSNTAAD